MSTQPLEIPGVGRARALKLPVVAERTLRNGLRVLAVRKPTVPRVEARLRIPAGAIYDGGDGARARLLAETLLGGTHTRSAVEIARELQRLGASLSASANSDDLHLTGGVLTANRTGFLALLAEIVARPSFPADEVAVARDRFAQEIIIHRSQPQSIASEATNARIFGRHRYGRGLPDPERVRRVGPAPIRAFHGARVFPKGSTLILVGDVQPDKAVDQVDAAMRAWKGKTSGPVVSAPPPMPAGLPTLIVDRPGAVQTNIRVAGASVPRNHPDFYKLALANMVFGGYFTSRLVNNIREDKGYTYSPGSALTHRRLSSTLSVIADVGTDVTAPALVEIRYELSRMAGARVKQEELDAARRYLAGVTMLQIQTQAGLATYLDAIIAAGLGMDYLRDFRSNLERVGVDDVYEAGARYLSPKVLTTVLVGDASRIRRAVEALDPVEVVNSG